MLFKKLCDPVTIEIGWHLAHGDSRDDFVTDPLSYADYAPENRPISVYYRAQTWVYQDRAGRLVSNAGSCHLIEVRVRRAAPRGFFGGLLEPLVLGVDDKRWSRIVIYDVVWPRVVCAAFRFRNGENLAGLRSHLPGPEPIRNDDSQRAFDERLKEPFCTYQSWHHQRRSRLETVSPRANASANCTAPL